MASPLHLPQCWGHRGASADFPENTIASFESTARAGADGVETDVYVTSDDRLLMYHDPTLGRTTDGGEGLVTDRPYEGYIDKLRTKRAPHELLPTLDDTVEWFMRPNNRHMILHLDIKAASDPKRLFPLMQKVFLKYPDWETAIAPRVILGLWHPAFIPYAETYLPSFRRCFIGVHFSIATSELFWNSCDGFSIVFMILCTPKGKEFIKRCKKEGKHIYTWTLNRPEQWEEAASWGVDAIMTDKPYKYIEARNQAEETGEWAGATDPWYKWKSLLYYRPVHWLLLIFFWRVLTKRGGKIDLTPPTSKRIEHKAS